MLTTGRRTAASRHLNNQCSQHLAPAQGFNGPRGVCSARDSSDQQLLHSNISCYLLDMTTTFAMLAVVGQATEVVEYREQPGRLNATLLVLDAGSLTYSGNHPRNASVTTAEQCSTICGQLPSCNAWTFCNNVTHGCGSGCAAWVADHPKRKSLSSSLLQAPQATLQVTRLYK